MIFSASFGQWLGLTIDESTKGQDVVVKDMVLNDVKVIAILSRHTILLQNETILVVPTGDISQFKSQTSTVEKVIPKPSGVK